MSIKRWIKELFGKRQPSMPNTLLVHPLPPRDDLIYCYYGSQGDQLAETQDHITHHFITNWDGATFVHDYLQLIAAVHDAKKGVVLGAWGLSDIDLQKVLLLSRQMFGDIIDIVYLWDEPNLAGSPSAQALFERARIVRDNSNAKLAVIYADNGNFPAISAFDYVGIDSYDKRERVLYDGTYDTLLRAMRDDQKLILVPGGWQQTNQDPRYFYNYAQNNKRVGIIMPFIWIDNAAQLGYGGIRTSPLRSEYESYGKKILNAGAQ